MFDANSIRLTSTYLLDVALRIGTLPSYDSTNQAFKGIDSQVAFSASIKCN